MEGSGKSMEWVEKVNGFFKMIPVSRVYTPFSASK